VHQVRKAVVYVGMQVLPGFDLKMRNLKTIKTRVIHNALGGSGQAQGSSLPSSVTNSLEALLTPTLKSIPKCPSSCPMLSPTFGGTSG